MHKTSGVRDPAAAFPLPARRDDTADHRDANRSVAVSAAGLAALALPSCCWRCSLGRWGCWVVPSTTCPISLPARWFSRLPAVPPSGQRALPLRHGAGRGPGRHRHRRRIWASAAFAGYESVRKLIEHGHTAHVGAGIAGAVIGIVGDQVVARDKLAAGRRIGSAALVADARHTWLDALSSAGALAGLIAVAAGQRWGDPVAGLAVTASICLVSYEVTAGVTRRLADG